MTHIERVHAREVYDSRGRPTVEVEITCAGGRRGRAIVPSGSSTGRFEAVELRDGDAGRLDGAGVVRAVENVRGEIARALLGMDADDQAAIDRRLCELDGTADKSRLGANAILGASLATAHTAAEAKSIPAVAHFHQLWKRLPAKPSLKENVKRTARLGNRLLLPLPMVNMISGGLHAGGNLDFQDFLILPVGAQSYRQALEWIVAVYHKLRRVLSERGCEAALVGDEGGYGPKLKTNVQALHCVLRAVEAAGLRPGEDVAIGLDVASTHFYRDGAYHISAAGRRTLTSNEMIDLLKSWMTSYPLLSIEDGLAEDDWDGWQRLTERLGDRVQLIGDDLFVTNRARLQQGIDRGAANSVLVKPNQIGTLWETLETVRVALDNGYWPVVSARSGETEDTTIADLAVALGVGQIKIGSVARSERLAKYNRLLRLEEELGAEAEYVGGAIFQALGRRA